MNLFPLVRAVFSGPTVLQQFCNDFLTGGTVESRQEAVRRSALAFGAVGDAADALADKEAEEEVAEPQELPDELWPRADAVKMYCGKCNNMVWADRLLPRCPVCEVPKSSAPVPPRTVEADAAEVGSPPGPTSAGQPTARLLQAAADGLQDWLCGLPPYRPELWHDVRCRAERRCSVPQAATGEAMSSSPDIYRQGAQWGTARGGAARRSAAEVRPAGPTQGDHREVPGQPGSAAGVVSGGEPER